MKSLLGVTTKASQNSQSLSGPRHVSEKKKSKKEEPKKRPDLLGLFIRNRTDFTIEPEAQVSSGRILISSQVRAQLDAKRSKDESARIELTTSVQLSTTKTASSTPCPNSKPITLSDSSSDDDDTSSSSSSSSSPGSSNNPISPVVVVPKSPIPRGSKRGFTAAPDFLQFADDRGPWLPVWCKQLYTHPHPAVRLHQECVDFVKWASLSSREIDARNFTLTDVTNVIRNVIPDARIEVFGSTRSGLVLPASDVDIMVIMSRNVASVRVLDLIRRAVEVHGSARRGEGFVIRNARVPVFKFRHLLTSIDVDISVNTSEGFEDTKRVRELADAYPAARPLTMLVKYFLKQRNLNDLSIGGLGSHAVLLLVLSFLQQRLRTYEWGSDEAHRQRAWRAGWVPLPPTAKIGLGGLLIEFFDYYGSRFDFQSVGIRVNRTGSLFHRTARCEDTASCVIEDPFTRRNVAGGSYRINQIATTFRQAFSALTAPLSAFPFAEKGLQNGETHAAHRYLWGRPTLLGRILHVDEELRHHRSIVESAWEYLPSCPRPPEGLCSHPDLDRLMASLEPDLAELAQDGIMIDNIGRTHRHNEDPDDHSDKLPSDEETEEEEEAEETGLEESMGTSLSSTSSGSRPSIDTEQILNDIDQIIEKEEKGRNNKKPKKNGKIETKKRKRSASSVVDAVEDAKPPKKKSKKSANNRAPSLKSVNQTQAHVSDKPMEQTPIFTLQDEDDARVSPLSPQRGGEGSAPLARDSVDQMQKKTQKKEKIPDRVLEVIPNVYEGFAEKGSEVYECQTCGRRLKTKGFCVFCAAKAHKHQKSKSLMGGTQKLLH